MKTENKIRFASFIKIISLCFIPLTILGIYEFAQIPFFKLTRPSAFYQVTYLLSFLPAMLFVLLSNIPMKWKCKLFKSTYNVNKFINIILSLQMLGSVSYAFLELRYSYFDLIIDRYNCQWVDIFLAIFYICIYLSNQFNYSKLSAIIFGCIYLLSQIWYHLYWEFEIGSLTIASMVTVIIFIIYTVIFVDFKTAFYFRNYSNHLVLDDNGVYERVNNYIIFVKNCRSDIIVLTYCSDYNLYLICNLNSEEVKTIDFDAIYDEITEKEYDFAFEALNHRAAKKAQVNTYL